MLHAENAVEPAAVQVRQQVAVMDLAGAGLVAAGMIAELEIVP